MELPILYSALELQSMFPGESVESLLESERVEMIVLMNNDGCKEYYSRKQMDVRKRARNSLSPKQTSLIVSPSTGRLTKVHKELREAGDLNRKLQLLKQYREREEYERLNGLIEKWESVVVDAVEELHNEAQKMGTGLTRQQFLAALQLDKNIMDLFADEDSFNNDYPDELVDCQCGSSEGPEVGELAN